MKCEPTVYNHMRTNQLVEYWGVSPRILDRWLAIG